MKYTQEQIRRSVRKLARKYGEWNKITANDAETRHDRTYAVMSAAFKVIQKSGELNEYFLSTGDMRGKRKPKELL